MVATDPVLMTDTSLPCPFAAVLEEIPAPSAKLVVREDAATNDLSANVLTPPPPPADCANRPTELSPEVDTELLFTT